MGAAESTDPHVRPMHLQFYPAVVLLLNMHLPIQINKTFEHEGVYSPSAEGRSFGKCLGLEGAAVNSRQAKPKHACIPLHSCLASLNRDLSAVKTITILLASPCFSLGDILWDLSSPTASGKRPRRTNKVTGWVCRRCLRCWKEKGSVPWPRSVLGWGSPKPMAGGD